MTGVQTCALPIWKFRVSIEIAQEINSNLNVAQKVVGIVIENAAKQYEHELK